jgi:GNAT superfamily N-acetyltransferase
MRRYIEQVYGWNEEDQEHYFRGSFHPQEIHVIQVDGKDAGMYVYDADEDGEVLLKRIEVLPEYQGQGIGSYIIKRLIGRAKKEGRDLRLHVFKINPARQLYSRLGFEVVHETETHYVMRVRHQMDVSGGT